jgi:hypothetical protein
LPVRQYLEGTLPAPALAKIFDDLVSANWASDLDPASAALVDDLHVALALYTPDRQTRDQEPRALIGPLELVQKAREFDDAVRRLGR